VGQAVNCGGLEVCCGGIKRAVGVRAVIERAVSERPAGVRAVI